MSLSEHMIVMNGHKFGSRGSYEYLSGSLTFGIDPKNKMNRNLCDLDLAPLNSKGLVEAKTNFKVLQPSDPKKRNGLAIVEVSNRGGIALMRYYNLATTGQVRPNVPADYGNEYLMREGYTLIWIGWEWDIPDGQNLLRLEVPILKNIDGNAVTGLVRSDWVIDQTISTLGVGHRNMIPYPVSSFDSPKNVLTYRNSLSGSKIKIPKSSWSFAGSSIESSQRGTLNITLSEGFQSGSIYELVYEAKDPVLSGYGLAAIRDIAAFVKYDPACPFPVKKTIAQGISQTGRFLRHFLYEGFNVDESGRIAYDGMMVLMAGAGRGSFNHRFAQPSRDAHRYSSFDYPTDLYPFASTVVYDTTLQKKESIRPYQDTAKIFYINSGYEYWSRGASLIHTDFTTQKDLKLPRYERYFHLASAQHYNENIPDSSRRIASAYSFYKGNPIYTLPYFKALLLQLKEWVLDHRLPSDHQIPMIADSTLVIIQKFKFPYIPGLDLPRSPYIPNRLYMGPRWQNAKIIDQEPPVAADPYLIMIPAVDPYGNERSGIKPIELCVPLATYTPWSLRFGLAHPGEMDDFRGLFIPLPEDAIQRTTRDMRPAFNGLYKNKDEYLSKIEFELGKLVAQRFLLVDDVPALKTRSSQLWDWIQTYYQR